MVEYKRKMWATAILGYLLACCAIKCPGYKTSFSQGDLTANASGQRSALNEAMKLSASADSLLLDDLAGMQKGLADFDENLYIFVAELYSAAGNRYLSAGKDKEEAWSSCCQVSAQTAFTCAANTMEMLARNSKELKIILNYHERAAQLYLKANDAKMGAISCYALGETYASFGIFEKAADFYQKAGTFFAKENLIPSACKAYQIAALNFEKAQLANHTAICNARAEQLSFEHKASPSSPRTESPTSLESIQQKVVRRYLATLEHLTKMEEEYKMLADVEPTILLAVTKGSLCFKIAKFYETEEKATEALTFYEQTIQALTTQEDVLSVSLRNEAMRCQAKLTVLRDTGES